MPMLEVAELGKSLGLPVNVWLNCETEWLEAVPAIQGVGPCLEVQVHSLFKFQIIVEFSNFKFD